MKMDHIKSHRPSTREQMLAELRADFEAASSAAEPRDEPIWRWLMTVADAERPLPLHGGHTRISAIAEQAGVPRHVAERLRTIADKWITRFAEAFGDPNAGSAAFDPDARAQVEPRLTRRRGCRPATGRTLHHHSTLLRKQGRKSAPGRGTPSA